MIHPQRFNWSIPVYSGTLVYKVWGPKGFVLYCPWIEPGGVRRAALVGQDAHLSAQHLLVSYGVERTLRTQAGRTR